MNIFRKDRDTRLELLEALIRYADQCGDADPHVYKDEMLRMLGVCDHVFNIMQKQLGDGYFRMVDNFDGRGRYAINVNGCFKLRDLLVKEEKVGKKSREGGQITVLATLIGTFFVIVFGF